MLISIEGLDGVGKSTLTSVLSSELKMSIISKPIKSLLELTPDQSKISLTKYMEIILKIFKQCTIYLAI